jgi:uncharacterized protein (TIGR00369 family)
MNVRRFASATAEAIVERRNFRMAGSACNETCPSFLGYQDAAMPRIASRTYGIVGADEQKTMTGLEFVKGLADGTLPLNTMAETLRYDLTEAENGRVVVTATPAGVHLNPAGTVHGGLAATMLDSCMGLAIQSTLEKGIGSTTLEFKISFVRPITPETGPIRAEGTVISRGRRVGTAEGRVTDSNGRLLVPDL